MSLFFNFGEMTSEYDFKVINEREARASAGIMFLLGTISLFNFILTKNLFFAEVFSVTFILEFVVRIFINPLYAPYMMLGSLFVRNQKPEWVEAKPKRFAWVLGLMLGAVMGYFILFNILTPARLIVCLLCLFLLYMEAVFGICLGCMLYKKLNLELKKCPGDVCEVWQKPKRANPIIMMLVASSFLGASYYGLKLTKYAPTKEDIEFQKELEEDNAFISGEDEEEESLIQEANSTTKKDCTPPQWAIDMGHKEMWLKHHGCK